MREREELEWNMAHYRIRTIGRLTEIVRERYVEASRNKNADNLSEYFTALKALYREIRLYMDDEPQEEIKHEIQEVEKWMQADGIQGDIFSKLEELDDRLNEERLDAGLDIPSKVRPDPDSALVDGLNQS